MDDDEEADMLNLPTRGRLANRTARANVPLQDNSPRDMRTLILSRQKRNPIDPREVKKLEKRFPEWRHLQDRFLAVRYLDVENYLHALHGVNQVLGASFADVMKYRANRGREQQHVLEVQYHGAMAGSLAKTHDTLKSYLTALDKATFNLRAKFSSASVDLLSVNLKQITRSIDRIGYILDEEFLLPKKSAIERIDGLLAHWETTREQYFEMQAKARVAMNGVDELTSLCVPHPEIQYPLPSHIAAYAKILQDHRSHFSASAHLFRSAWMGSRLANHPLQQSQPWPIQASSSIVAGMKISGEEVMEAIILRETSEDHMKLLAKIRNKGATILQQNYTKRWHGTKPPGSPELDKAWRQLDVIAPIERFNILTWWLQCEVLYLNSCLRGFFGTMFDHVSPDYHVKSGLSAFTLRIVEHRRQIMHDIREYKYINWIRLETEDKMHQLGIHNEFQARGILVPPKPLSQDMNLFLGWSNQIADMTHIAWTRNKLHDIQRSSKTQVLSAMSRMTMLYLEVHHDKVFHVPELGTKRDRMKQAWKAKRMMAQQEGEPEQGQVSGYEPGDDHLLSMEPIDPSELAWSSDALEVPLPRVVPTIIPKWKLQKEVASGPTLEKSRPLRTQSEQVRSTKTFAPAPQPNSPTHNETSSASVGEKGPSWKKKNIEIVIKGTPSNPKVTQVPVSKSKSEGPRRRDEPKKRSEVLNSGPISTKKPIRQANNVKCHRPGISADAVISSKEAKPTGVAASSKKDKPKRTAHRRRGTPLLTRHFSEQHRRNDVSRLYSTCRTLWGNEASQGLLYDTINPSHISPQRESPERKPAQDSATKQSRLEASSAEPKTEDAAVISDFWSHSTQTRPDGGNLIVHYCRTLESTEEVARHFLKNSVIGFDMEWKSNASTNDSIQNNLSLIQIANDERIALFQIALFRPAKHLSELVAPSLKQVLESPDITKVGVSIKADTTRLRKYLGINASSIFELSHLFKLVKYGQENPKLVNKRNINLSDQVKEHLGLPLKKTDDVRCSNWARPLNYSQVQCMSLLT